MPRDHLSDHEYDGIREYDNPTPGWWHLIFIATVLFSLLYFVYYHTNPAAPTPQSRWAADQVRENKKIFGALGELKNDEATIVKLMGDERLMSVAEGMFLGNCAQCHGADGSGKNGVNLTDDHYKNVRALTDFFSVITNGANNGAMPSWKAQYSSNERILLSAFAASMRSRKLSGRAPEGDVLPPWPTAAAASTPAPAAP